MPRHREIERCVPRRHRIEDDVVSPAASRRVCRFWRSRVVVRRGENLLEVPDTVRVLNEMHVRMLDETAPNKNTAVDQVARIIRTDRLSGARQQLSALVAYSETVDRDVCQEIPAKVPDVDRAAANLARDPWLQQAAQSLAASVRARDEEDRADDEQSKREQNRDADKRHEPSTR